jgi:hypothetical protein
MSGAAKATAERAISEMTPKQEDYVPVHTEGNRGPPAGDVRVIGKLLPQRPPIPDVV